MENQSRAFNLKAGPAASASASGPGWSGSRSGELSLGGWSEFASDFELAPRLLSRRQVAPRSSPYKSTPKQARDRSRFVPRAPPSPAHLAWTRRPAGRGHAPEIKDQHS
eukprot:790446-Rhodomonas_salina.1